MANNLNTNPKYVDTAATISSTPLYVSKLWFHGAVDADDIIIKDLNGNILWQAAIGAVADGPDIEVDFCITFPNFVVDTIDGGFLLIYS